MATRHEQTFYRAIGIHDPRWTQSNVDEASSTASQDGPEPDQPVPDAALNSYAQLESYGTAAAGTTLTVKSVKEGTAVGGAAGGRFCWRPDTTADDNLGWLSFNKMTGWEAILVHDGLGSGTSFPRREGYQTPHAIRTPDHKVICVYNDYIAGEYKCAVRDPLADTWTHYTIIAKSKDTSYGTPTVLRVPSGRLLCFYRLYELTETTTTYESLGMSFSDDDGATWIQGGKHIHPIRDTSALWYIRAVYHDGFITLLTYQGHYVSADLGASFTKITDAHDGYFDVGLSNYADAPLLTYYQFGDLVALNDGRVVLIKSYVTSGQTQIQRWVKDTPFGKFSDDPAAGTIVQYRSDDTDYSSGTSMYRISQACCACVDDAGDVYVLSRGATGDGERSSIQLAKLDGVTLAVVTGDDDTLSEGLSVPYYLHAADLGRDDGVFLDRWTLVPHKGALLVLTNQRAGNSTFWFSLYEMRLGGYSNYDWRVQTFGGRRLAAAAGYTTGGLLYVPLEVPSTIAAWTSTGTATAEINANAELRTDNTDADSIFWEATGGSVGQPIVCMWRVKSEQTSLGAACHVRARIANGTQEYVAVVEVSDTAANLVDEHGTTTLGSVTGLSGSDYRDYLFVVESTALAAGCKAALFYRAITGGRWIEAASGSLTDTAGTPSVANSIRWGKKSGTGTGNTLWRFFGVCHDVHEWITGIASTGTYTNPGDLIGRPYALNQLYVDEGTRLASIGSSTYRNDEWTIPTRYEYGYHQLDPTIAGSPSVKWRAVDAAEQTIIWELDGAGVDARFLSTSIYCYIGEPNFTTATLEGYDGSAWNVLLTLNTTTDLQSLAFTRVGAYVTVDTGTSQAAARYVQLDELVNGYVLFDPSGSPPYARKILRNSEGIWTDQTNRRLEIEIDSSDLGSVPTSGTCEIRAPRVLGVRHNLKTAYEAYRVKVDAQTTEEGKLQAGVVSVGPIVVLGRDYDYPWSWSIEPNAELTEGADGQRRVQSLGPARRAVELSWPEGWDMSQIQGTPDPDYILARNAAGYEGIGVRADATILEGLVRRTEGGRYPVVLIPKMPPAVTVSDQACMTGISEMLYGRTLGGVTRVTINGDDFTDEVVTINAITIEEEV